MKTKQFIVLGTPRGGTSLVAGTLIGMGVYMGTFHSNQYEDEQFKQLCAKGASRKDFKEYFEYNDNKFYAWGCKLPNSIYFFRRFYKCLTNPHFIIIYRDPDLNAKSALKHDNRAPGKLPSVLNHVKRHNKLIERAQKRTERAELPLLVLNLEDCQEDLQLFTNRMKEFAGLPEAPEPNNTLLHGFLQPDGGYNRIFEDHQDKLNYFYKNA